MDAGLMNLGSLHHGLAIEFVFQLHDRLDHPTLGSFCKSPLKVLQRAAVGRTSPVLAIGPTTPRGAHLTYGLKRAQLRGSACAHALEPASRYGFLGIQRVYLP